MENKNVGYIIIGISLLIIIVIFLFNSTLKEIISQGCSLEHAASINCPMYDSVTKQTYLALGIVGILVLIGVILVFSKPEKEIIVKKVKEKKKAKIFDLSGLKKEEKDAFNLIKQNGTIFQADLIEKLNFGKAKMSRVIDRLEGRGLVERKRRGMTNVVVLKED